MSDPTFAFGVLLRLTSSDAGGRQTSLPGGDGPEVRFRYRPNWGLPGMTPPDQTGAPVLAFSRSDVAPGDEVRVVIVPPFPEMVPLWAEVQPGTELPMYEGVRVCGVGRVLWRTTTEWPLPEADEERFRGWLSASPGDEDSPV